MGGTSNPERDEKIIALRESGKSYSEIGAELGISGEAVAWQCLRLGAEHPTKKTRSWNGIVGPAEMKRGNHIVRRFTPEEDTRLIELEAQGKNNCQIGRELGRRPNSIKGRLMALARRDERREAAR